MTPAVVRCPVRIIVAMVIPLGEDCPAFSLQMPPSPFPRLLALAQGSTAPPSRCTKHSLWLLSSSVGADTNIFFKEDKSLNGSDNIFNPPKETLSTSPSTHAPRQPGSPRPWGQKAGTVLPGQPVNVHLVRRLNITAVLLGKIWREASAKISHA